MYIDLNCDAGESFGNYTLGNDAELFNYVSSVNIACGFHAGDPNVMRRTVALALQKHVEIGAHPGLPDLHGFGRRFIDVSPDEIYNLIIYQIGALQAFVKAEGGTLSHVKPHGALYNMAAQDKEIARAIAEAVYKVDEEMILYGLSGSMLIQAGKEAGLRTAQEAFADRTYRADGSLTNRGRADAFITNAEEAVAQIICMIQEGKVFTVDDTELLLHADTICIHGDGPHAISFAKQLQQVLQQEGVIVQSLRAGRRENI
jgi:UPF0271 protein